MNATTTGAALYAAIALQPEEQAPRDAYLDWLTENDHDAACAARAEFIRVQCELERTERTGCCDKVGNTFTTVPTPRVVPCDCQWATLLRRGQLLGAHEPDWRRSSVCPSCENRRPPHCLACHGTGDAGGLLRGFIYGDPELTQFAQYVRVTFARGLPDAVECRFADVATQVDVMEWCEDCQKTWKESTLGEMLKTGECMTCNGANRKFVTQYRPTSWATAVTRAHPIRRFRIIDKTPQLSATETDPPRSVHVWWKEGHGTPSAALPAPIFAALIARHATTKVARDRVTVDDFETPEQANDALALALGYFVRGAK